MSPEPAAGFDPVDLAVLSSRFTAIVRNMANTLIRTGRSGVLNTAATSRAASSRARRAAGDGREPADPRDERARHDGPRHAATAIRSSGAATRSCTTRPTTATRMPPTTRMLVPVIDDDGVHRFTVLAKAHQADCGNAEPTTYYGDGARRLRGGRADLPVRAGPGGLPRHRGHHPHVPAADPRAGAVVGRLPRPARRGPHRRARAARARPRSSAGTRSTTTRTSGSTTASGGWSTAIAPLPERRRVTVAARARSVPGRRRRASRSRSTSTSIAEAGTIEVDLRDNPDCLPCGLNLTEATAAHGGDGRRLQRASTTRPAERRQLPPHRASTCARTAASASRAIRPAARSRRRNLADRVGERRAARDRRARRRARHGRGRASCRRRRRR